MEKAKMTLAILLIGWSSLLQPVTAAVKINGTSFPDANFRAVVQSKFDTNGDCILSKNEIAAAVKLDCSKCGITSLKGIEYLTALQALNCSNNSIVALNLSHNKELKTLDASNNSRKINIYSNTNNGETVYYIPVKSLNSIVGFYINNIIDNSCEGARIGEVNGVKALIFDDDATTVSYSFKCVGCYGGNTTDIPDDNVPKINDIIDTGTSMLHESDIPDENVPKINDIIDTGTSVFNEINIPDDNTPTINSTANNNGIIDTGTSMLQGIDIPDPDVPLFYSVKGDVINEPTVPLLTGSTNIEDPEFPWIVKFDFKISKPAAANKVYQAKATRGGISSSLGSDVKVDASAGCINVAGNRTDNVIVVNMNGKTVFNGNSSQIDVPAGLYIVTIGNTVKKLIVK
jgi:hypothetical protein